MQNNITVEKNTFSKSNHIETIQKIEYIESLFDKSNVNISPQSDLFKLLGEVKENYSEYNSEALMIKALYINRIANAMLCLENIDNKEKYLYDLLKGSLDVLEHKPSHAKSILFELEVLTQFQSFVKESYLDEPDVVVPTGEDKIGISCKKITSENNLQKTFSNGVKQIEKNSFNYGIVAINIDDLLPEKALLNANTIKDVDEILFSHNMDFINKHQRHFLKYIKDSRILAVLVYSSIFTDIKSHKPRFNTAYQTSVWTVKDLKEDQRKILNSLKDIMQ